MTDLLERFQERIGQGRKLLVPYLMSGIPDRASFGEAFDAVADHADAVELGLPYSDPLMDGPVIADAGERAIRSGLGPLAALDLAAGLATNTPKVVMTYYNPIHRVGEKDFVARLVDNGIAGLIVPDVPLEESGNLRDILAAEGIAWIPLVAPTSSPDRVRAITATATGFVYAVSTLGVTGTRESLSERAGEVVAACREVSEAPVLVGIGVSNAAQAVEAAGQADGVVIGSAVVRTILEQGAPAANALLREIRSALDSI